MTDNELLLAISNMMDNKLEHINQDIHEVKKDIKELKTEVNNMNARLNNMDIRLNNLDARVKNMDIRLNDLDARMKNMELTQETQILPRLDTIISCYTDTFDRYKDYSDKMESDRNLLISSAIFSYS